MQESDPLRPPSAQKNAHRTAEKSREIKGGRKSADVRVSRLDTLAHLRAELGRLYREARRREGRDPDAQTALRLANILGAIRQSIEVEELERRIAELEAQTLEQWR